MSQLRLIVKAFVSRNYPEEKDLFDDWWGSFEGWLPLASAEQDKIVSTFVLGQLGEGLGFAQARTSDLFTPIVLATTAHVLFESSERFLTLDDMKKLVKRVGKSFGATSDLLRHLIEHLPELIWAIRTSEAWEKVRGETPSAGDVEGEDEDSEMTRLAHRIQALETISRNDPFTDFIIGRSQAVRDLIARIQRVSWAEETVLITGEPGVGKELVAQAIYRSSSGRREPLVSSDLSTVPKDLLGSTLFGHERGAFTGATALRKGIFEDGNGGTVFLDEVGNLPDEYQKQLLRVLETREVVRLGSNHAIQVDFRLIVATNRDLEKGVAEGVFREDLFDRLYVLPIDVPSLRCRKEDIPDLVRHFLDELGRKTGHENIRLSEDAMRMLLLHDWPGNVRELRNCIRGAFYASDGSVIRSGDITLAKRRKQNPRKDPYFRDGEFLTRAVDEYGGVRSAARALKIPPSTISDRLKRYRNEKK